MWFYLNGTIMLIQKKFLFQALILFSIFFLRTSNASPVELGVQIHAERFNNPPELMISLIKKYNIKSFRTDYNWRWVEKQKEIYTPTKDNIENIIKLSKKNNIDPLLILSYNNKIYSPIISFQNNTVVANDEAINAFANYTGWTASHFKGTVSKFEIWNEWIQSNIKTNKQAITSNDSAQIYANLVVKSCTAIKQSNPKAIVVAGSTSPLDASSNTWLINFLSKKGVLGCIDGISLHPYNFNVNKSLNSQPVIQSIINLHTTLANKFPNKNINFYITEIGVPSVENADYSMQDTVNYFQSFMSDISKLSYVKGVWWYDFINDGNNPFDKEHNFGILNNDFSPKPVAKALQGFKINDDL